jgi:hypothetical protein
LLIEQEQNNSKAFIPSSALKGANSNQNGKLLDETRTNYHKLTANQPAIMSVNFADGLLVKVSIIFINSCETGHLINIFYSKLYKASMH